MKPYRFRPSQERHAVKSPLARAWNGGSVILIANGPSLTSAQVNTARNIWAEGRAHAIGINDAYRIAPWVDALYACDPEWWHVHIKAVRDTNIVSLYCQDEETCDRYGLWWTPGKHKAGLSTAASCIHYGRHSGFQALNVAFHLGARRIMLLGYDCRTHNGMTHWFGDHPGVLHQKSSYDGWAAAYADAVPMLRAAGVEVFNCTPNSAITAFPHTTLSAVFGVRQ